MANSVFSARSPDEGIKSPSSLRYRTTRIVRTTVNEKGKNSLGMNPNTNTWKWDCGQETCLVNVCVKTWGE